MNVFVTCTIFITILGICAISMLLYVAIRKTQVAAFVHIPKNAGTAINSILRTHWRIPIKIIHHPYPKMYTNEIVVLRDPVDRFISAFYYAKKNYKNKYNDQFDTPNQFAEALADTTHPKHNTAQIMITNTSDHTILGKQTPFTWTFMPQCAWVRHPKFVLRFSHLEQDFNQCLYDLGFQTVYIRIPKKNTTVHYNKYMSPTALRFVKQFYRRDYTMLAKHPFTYE
jgi:hypothetical protein